MIKLERQHNLLTIASIYELNQLEKIELNPSYQRHSVWGEEEKSALIDTILHNYPIPPIFFFQRIDDKTGKTSYEVIDGKQRLQSIFDFIEGNIRIPDDFSNEKMADMSFSDLIDDYSFARKDFWRYELSIEYIDSDDVRIIDEIFDRLNRNGKPLKAQELRKASYHSSKLFILVHELKNKTNWSLILEDTVNNSRMEDDEFITELLISMIKANAIDSTGDKLDILYSEYVKKFDKMSLEEINGIEKTFIDITIFLSQIELDYDKYDIRKVSHLYALWIMALNLIDKDINLEDITFTLTTFFEELRTRKNRSGIYLDYMKSMSSNTKSKSQRNKRANILIDLFS